MSQQHMYYLGIDGGGSKCKARLENLQGDCLGEGISGPANPVRGVELAQTSILEAAHLALKDAGLEHLSLNQLYAGMGLAGVNLPKYRQMMAHWQHPFAKMQISTDLHIACLGAHNGEDGAVIITGTGSSGASVVKGNYFEIGGHGFPVGDCGAGAWLGLTAIKQSLKALDDLSTRTPLVDALLARLNCATPQEVVEVIIDGKPAFYAAFAPLIMEFANQGDEMASAIVTEGADYLSCMARRLLQNQPPRLSLIGGLAPLITPWLDADIQARISAPFAAPEVGATLLARQTFPF